MPHGERSGSWCWKRGSPARGAGDESDIVLGTDTAMQRQAILFASHVIGYHAPTRFQVNRVVQNIDEWYAAIGAGPEETLYVPPENRVRISWGRRAVPSTFRTTYLSEYGNFGFSSRHPRRAVRADSAAARGLRRLSEDGLMTFA